MQLTVTTGGDDIFPIDVSEDLELENFKALLEFECGIAANEITIYRDGKLLEGEKQSVGSLGVKNGDVLLMVKKAPLQPRPSQQQRPMQQQRPATAQGKVDIMYFSVVPCIRLGYMEQSHMRLEIYQKCQHI